MAKYWEWVWDWHRAQEEKQANILWVYYEDIKSNPSREISRIVDFLNFSDLIYEEEDIATIVKNSSFAEMRAMVKNGLDTYVDGFFRKGMVGDHKNALTDKQIGLLNMITSAKFHLSSLRYGKD